VITRIAAAQYRRGLDALEAGDLDTLLGQFHPSCRMTFVGDTPLGIDGATGPALREWFERFLRLLPERRFTCNRLVVSGAPWRIRLASHMTITGTVAGEPYRNQFAHFLVIRWGRVVDDLVLEDTQQWERACRRLVDVGVTEAAAPPFGTRG
jgi:ketosteroid isomerase-like protein